MKTKLFALLCALALLVSAVPAASALEGEAVRSADILSTLGLIQGNAAGDYDLDAPATRAQAAVILCRMAGGAGSWRGTGGMATKLSAAGIVMAAGCDMVITNGTRMEELYGIVEGRNIGTRFVAR